MENIIQVAVSAKDPEQGLQHNQVFYESSCQKKQL